MAIQPNGFQITSHKEGYLPISHLNEKALHCHIFQDLKVNLIFILQMCDNGYTAKFDKETSSTMMKELFLQDTEI